MIFETERLIVRKLIIGDLDSFHEMQSNINVMKFADGEVKTLLEHQLELKELINKYQIKNNDFWIFAIERKCDAAFIGTLAFVKDHFDDEIGYRFLEKFWGLGYGLETCKGAISYCTKIGLKKIIGYVADENIASVKILKNNNFVLIDNFINEEHEQESKYELIL